MVFFLVGWALPWRGALWAVAIGAVVVQAGWWLCADRCVLTILEEQAREGGAATNPEREVDFLARLLSGLTGRPVPARWVNRAAYGVLWGSCAVALLRLAPWR